MVLAKEPEADGELFADDLLQVKYGHVEDDDDTVRVHDFRPGAFAMALPGGQAVLLFREKGRIWEDV